MKYSEKELDIAVETMKFDIDDVFARGINYFSCGWGKSPDFNYTFSLALSLIGSSYGRSYAGQSDYHRGVAFLAHELNDIPKRQIKVLRKKVHARGGFVFRTPYSVALIVGKMIELLKKLEGTSAVDECSFLEHGRMYREVLIGDNYEAIKESTRKGNEKIKDVSKDLKKLTIKIGE